MPMLWRTQDGQIADCGLVSRTWTLLNSKSLYAITPYSHRVRVGGTRASTPRRLAANEIQATRKMKVRTLGLQKLRKAIPSVHTRDTHHTKHDGPT